MKRSILNTWLRIESRASILQLQLVLVKDRLPSICKSIKQHGQLSDRNTPWWFAITVERLSINQFWLKLLSRLMPKPGRTASFSRYGCGVTILERDDGLQSPVPGQCLLTGRSTEKNPSRRQCSCDGLTQTTLRVSPRSWGACRFHSVRSNST